MKTKEFVSRKAFRSAVVLAIAAVLACVLTCVISPVSALADEGSSSAASPSSTSSASSSSSEASAIATDLKNGMLPLMGNDCVWFGENLNLKNTEVQNDLIAAGRTIKASDCTILGDIRAAGQTITISNCTVNENITVAGETVHVTDSDANAVAIGGNTASFSGSCSNLIVYANVVFIDGEVEGDVVVGANKVEIGTNSRIKGTLYVSAPSDPVMQRGAEVADVEYTQTEEGASIEDLGGAFADLIPLFMVMTAILGIISTLIIAVLAEWLFRRHTAAAADMIRTRTGATIGSGIIGAIAAPVAIIILCALTLTLPVAGALVLALLAMSMVAGGFAGASLFKLAFPRLGRFPCALAGGAIVGVASAIPFLGALVEAAAFMYFLGYVLQSIFLSLRENKSPYNTPTTPGI